MFEKPSESARKQQYKDLTNFKIIIDNLINKIISCYFLLLKTAL